jgi:hypothetical protein
MAPSNAVKALDVQSSIGDPKSLKTQDEGLQRAGTWVFSKLRFSAQPN